MQPLQTMLVAYPPSSLSSIAHSLCDNFSQIHSRALNMRDHPHNGHASHICRLGLDMVAAWSTAVMVDSATRVVTANKGPLEKAERQKAIRTWSLSLDDSEHGST